MKNHRAVALLAVSHGAVDVYQGAVAALIPYFVAERAYSYAAASGVLLAASVLSSVIQPVFGALTDRRAIPWLLPVSTLVAGAGIGLAGSFSGYTVVLVVVAVSGVGVAAYHPESARVARIASAGSHAGMGWFSFGGNVGFSLAPLLVAVAMAPGGLAYTPLLVVPAVLGSVLCLIVLRAVGARTAGTAHTGPAVGTDDVGSFVRLSFAIVFRSIAFVVLSAFVALYAAQRTGWGSVAGTVALTVLYVGGAVGTVVGSRLAERFGRIQVVRVGYLASTAAVAGVVFVPGPTMLVFVGVAAAALYLPFSLQITLGQDYLPTRVGTASGVTLGLTITVGGMFSPVVGAVADATNLQTALTPLVVVPALGWLLLRSLPEPRQFVDHEADHAAGDPVPVSDPRSERLSNRPGR